MLVSYNLEENALDSIESTQRFLAEAYQNQWKYKWAVFAADHAVYLFSLLFLSQVGLRTTGKGDPEWKGRVVDFWRAFKDIKSGWHHLSQNYGASKIPEDVEEGVHKLHDDLRNRLWHYSNLTLCTKPEDYSKPLRAAADYIILLLSTNAARICAWNIHDRAEVACEAIIKNAFHLSDPSL